MMRSGSRSNDVVGLRFQPTDEELVIGYLLRKLTGLPLLSDKYVFDCDLYGSEEPWEIWARFRDGGGGGCSGYRYFGDDKDEDLYFFTPLKKKTPTSIRIERSVGSSGGSWHGEDTGKVSTSSDGRISWIQKRFSYERRDKRMKKRNRNQSQEQQSKSNDGGGGDDQVVWIMHEYSLNRAVPSLGLDGASFNRYALCRIRKKETPMSKKRKLAPAAAAEPPRIFLVEIDGEDDYFSQDETESAPPATITTTSSTTSFSDHSVSPAPATPDFATNTDSSSHQSVPDAAAATTSSGQSVSTAPDSRDYLSQELIRSMDPEWEELEKEFWKFLGDEFPGASADFCSARVVMLCL